MFTNEENNVETAAKPAVKKTTTKKTTTTTTKKTTTGTKSAAKKPTAATKSAAAKETAPVAEEIKETAPVAEAAPVVEAAAVEETKPVVEEKAEETKPVVEEKTSTAKLSGHEITDEKILEVKNVDVHFKIGKKVIKACNNLSFDIFKGETFGLVGESGSGKTTISRAILGVNKVTNGEIIFKDKLISQKLPKAELMDVKSKIQMIFQDPAACLNERANVDYIVSEGLVSFKKFESEEERLTKVQNVLTSVGLLPEHLTRYPHEFSGGQRQRIGIARALVIEPELVLADEPISALDVSIRAQVLNLLKELQHKNKLTYLFIAHDLSIIKYISDRIAVMHQGYIVELGTSEQIYEKPIHPYTRSLLTAIPQPDPKSERNRKRIAFNKGDLDYSTLNWMEVEPGHFVLTNDELLKEWK